MNTKPGSESAKARDAVAAGMFLRGAFSDDLHAQGIYKAECIGPREDVREQYVALRDDAYRLDEEAGRFSKRSIQFKRLHGEANKIRRVMRTMEEVKWNDTIHNIVTTVGKNDMLDKYLAGSSYTAAIVMGLKGTGTAVIADTQASHASWLEQGLANAPTYTGNRPAPSLSAASSGVKSTSAAVSFAITSSGTVFGCFINASGSSTKDNTTGVLFSAGDFTGGSKAVTNGDTLNVTYSMTLT